MSEILSKTDREYIASMIPENLPDWKKSWQEGYEIGKGIEIPETPFFKKHGVKNLADYLLRKAEEGKVMWKILEGFATLEEEIEGMKAVQKWNEETGLCISCVHQLPQNTVGVPKDKRENLPLALGYMLEEPQDWVDLAMASDVHVIYADNHLGWPNAVYTTINSLKAGSTYTGLIGTFFQVAPGCPDEVWNQNENVKALGIVAAKYGEKVIANSNMDDTAPAYYMDFASSLAWGRLERYIVSDLCKARYSYSFGNFTSNLINMASMVIAGTKVFSKDDQPGMGYVNGNTVDSWDHHVHGNFSFAVAEAMMLILVVKKYRLGCGYIPVPMNEKVTIPTLEEILDMSCACQRSEEMADYFGVNMDWTMIEKLSDELVDFSDKMFQNILTGLKEAGVDITNPTEMLVVLKRLDPTRFEKMFHPSVVQDGNDQIIPLMPATLWERSQKLIDEFVEELKDNEIVPKVKGRSVCMASGDIHYCGALVISETMKRLGVDVYYGGNQLEALDILDLADEQGITDICISLHNGQALPYAKLLKKLADSRNKNYKFIMGGVMMSFEDEDALEPTDVTKQIEDLGIIVTRNVEEVMQALLR
ncbi:hypothetical protein C3B58_15830 [Lactonifactor longoviformis]|uniref:B12 binding domain-containing protein n=1 Tax=Lactonifactor longoviformis DSM 17459 TaxID=1122155 RepID=A0A1M4X5B8_9CLOT|nr:cobalamin B12-binding domain-containing protein [Lactonifactor longoviformis]POP31576.1 hypothetical protein C3B58_15830 [Lactonifactor longoviformis]SHE88666.1 B12 binding domain-containing protein [Lactonifactor longoviformis DSM 17459]